MSTNIKKRRRGAILSFRCPHLANTCQNGFVFVLFVAEPCVTEDWSICPIFPSQIGFSEVPMMGFEPIPRFSRERILSPLRLPFRHIGAVKLILAAFCYPTNRDLMGITFAKQCPKRREESVFPVRNFMFAAKRSLACGFWLVPRAPLLFGKSSTRRRARNTPRKATTKKTFRRRSPILTRQHLAA